MLDYLRRHCEYAELCLSRIFTLCQAAMALGRQYDSLSEEAPEVVLGGLLRLYHAEHRLGATRGASAVGAASSLSDSLDTPPSIRGDFAAAAPMISSFIALFCADQSLAAQKLADVLVRELSSELPRWDQVVLADYVSFLKEPDRLGVRAAILIKAHRHLFSMPSWLLAHE